MPVCGAASGDLCIPVVVVSERLTGHGQVPGSVRVNGGGGLGSRPSQSSWFKSVKLKGRFRHARRREHLKKELRAHVTTTRDTLTQQSIAPMPALNRGTPVKEPVLWTRGVTPPVEYTGRPLQAPPLPTLSKWAKRKQHQADVRLRRALVDAWADPERAQ